MAEKYRIHIENSGEDYSCSSDLSLLHGMEQLGRKGIPVGCRGGGCGVCKVHIDAGPYMARKMSRACISAEEEGQGVVLACRVFPRGEISLTVVGKMVKAIERGCSPEPLAASTEQLESRPV